MFFSKTQKNGAGFTLIELLIVVAIIAILAAIAVPNFLEAQTRAKIAAVKGDQSTIRTALEAYALEGKGYPLDSDGWTATELNSRVGGFTRLTTPIGFMQSIPVDVFATKEKGYGKAHQQLYVGNDVKNKTLRKTFWVLLSVGPGNDTMTKGPGSPLNQDDLLVRPTKKGDTSGNTAIYYDASNGTVAEGAIVKPSGNLTYFERYN